ncbi:MAG: ABC transporter ATP-binding protein, partial [Deltaproteobacteria bacterium]
ESFEETMVMLNALLRPNPPLICLDEITARLSDSEREVVIERVLMISQSRAVLFVSHNQTEVESITDSVILLAGGMLQEHTPTPEFFANPRSDAGVQFVRTGGVSLPRIGTPARHLRSDLRGVPEGMRLSGDLEDPKGPMQFLIAQKLCVFSPSVSDVKATLADPKALIDAGVLTVIYVADAMPENLGALEKAGIYEDWLRIPGGDDVPMADYMRRCERINSRIKMSPGVLIVDQTQPSLASRAAAMQMLYMGLSAERACEVLKELVGEDTHSVADEQLLWDLELAIDLESDTRSTLFSGDDQGLRFGASRAEPLVSQADNRLIGSDT